MTARYFSVDEANAMIPSLEAAFARTMQLRAQLRTIYQQLRAAGQVSEAGEQLPDPSYKLSPSMMRRRALARGLAELLRAEVDAIQTLGCVIKDLETGSVDWLAQFDGRDIYLCWKYGEREVSHWHDIEAGFVGRRPVSDLP